MIDVEASVMTATKALGMGEKPGRCVRYTAVVMGARQSVRSPRSRDLDGVLGVSACTVS